MPESGGGAFEPPLAEGWAFAPPVLAPRPLEPLALLPPDATLGTPPVAPNGLALEPALPKTPLLESSCLPERLEHPNTTQSEPSQASLEIEMRRVDIEDTSPNA
jgi:hypothetical protein